MQGRTPRKQARCLVWDSSRHDGLRQCHIRPKARDFVRQSRQRGQHACAPLPDDGCWAHAGRRNARKTII